MDAGDFVKYLCENWTLDEVEKRELMNASMNGGFPRLGDMSPGTDDGGPMENSMKAGVKTVNPFFDKNGDGSSLDMD